MRFCHLLCGGLGLGDGGAPKSLIISILWLWMFPGMAASNCNSTEFEILKESLAKGFFIPIYLSNLCDQRHHFIHPDKDQYV